MEFWECFRICPNGTDFSTVAVQEGKSGCRPPQAMGSSLLQVLAPEGHEYLNDPLTDHDSGQRRTLTGATNSWRYWERKYSNDGELQLMLLRSDLPEALKLLPIPDHENANEIIMMACQNTSLPFDLSLIQAVDSWSYGGRIVQSLGEETFRLLALSRLTARKEFQQLA